MLQMSAKVDVERLISAAKIALSATMSGALYFYLSSSSGLSAALAVRIPSSNPAALAAMGRKVANRDR
jgi:hypothetical protein